MPLRWTWFDGARPFVTNGNFRDDHHSSSETNSDSLIATMFNLDRLNMNRPEVRDVSLWGRGQIPESLDSLVEDLVRRVNRDRFHFELGGASDGPHLTRDQAQCYEVNRTRDYSQLGLLAQSEGGVSAAQVPTFLTNQWAGMSPYSTRSVVSPESVSPTHSESHFNPFPLNSNQRDVVWNASAESMVEGSTSKKRIRREFGRLGRNIKQRIFCGFFQREEGRDDQGVEHNREVQREDQGDVERGNPSIQYNPNGQREAGLQQLPQSP
ncbi:hypothetical protein CMV_014442 [Castanea mollissima]|uniref:Uncharacterized protein n=1 Tax=Castanea mollissima TaxID=60419 RepID=A0A8J4QXY0_9ROSI|nr:hypothetical protein CMV_014442 [Castanea mollissima]